jgi:hypothetical protein
VRDIVSPVSDGGIGDLSRDKLPRLRHGDSVNDDGLLQSSGKSVASMVVVGRKQLVQPHDDEGAWSDRQAGR